MRFATLVLLIGLAIPSVVFGDTDEDIVEDWRGFLTRGMVVYGLDYNIVVATILAVRDSGSTQGNPPQVTIDVKQVLRGSRRIGVQSVRWEPNPLYMPCAVGEEAYIRRWDATPMEGPRSAIGHKMILGGARWGSGSDWGCSVFCRWEYSDSLRDLVMKKVRAWKPVVDANRPAALERRAKARAREEARLNEEHLRAKESAWFANQREITVRSDFELLARRSSYIVMGTLTGTSRRGLGWQPELRVEKWLRFGGSSAPRERTVQLFLGTREDSLIRRWAKRPPDVVPGSKGGRLVKCLAFLTVAHDSTTETPWRAYRPVDGDAGILLAEPFAQSRAKAAIQRFRNEPPDPGFCRTAELSEFLGLDSLQVSRVGFKISALPASPRDPWARSWDRLYSLVFGGTIMADSTTTLMTTSSFAASALPFERYAQDFNGEGLNLFVPANAMEALLDSLGTLPTLMGPNRNREGDVLTLTLQRSDAGHERVYESTLDQDTYFHIVKIFATVLPAWVRLPCNTNEHLLDQVSLWTRQYDPRVRQYWADRPDIVR